MNNKILVTTLLLAMFGLGEKLEALKMLPAPSFFPETYLNLLLALDDVRYEKLGGSKSPLGLQLGGLKTTAMESYASARDMVGADKKIFVQRASLYDKAAKNFQAILDGYSEYLAEDKTKILGQVCADCYFLSVLYNPGNSSNLQNAINLYESAGLFERAGDAAFYSASFVDFIPSKRPFYQQAFDYYNQASTSARLKSKINEVNQLLDEAREEDAAQSERVRDAGRPRSTRRELKEGEYQPGQGFYYGIDQTTGRQIFEMNPRHR